MDVIIKRQQTGFPVIVCIPICQPDADLWLDQLLINLSLFPVELAWFCDNLNDETIDKIDGFPKTIGYTRLDDPKVIFNEQFRQCPLDIAVRSGAKWMFRMDCDEQIEPNDWPLIGDIVNNGEDVLYQSSWYNVWQNALPYPLIRFDPPFEPRQNFRVVLHPLKGRYTWKFRHGSVASAYSTPAKCPEVKINIRLIHWGLSTRELRIFHKKRWDKLYAENPYGMWNAACDETKESWLHPYAPWLTHQEYVDLLTKVGSMVSPELAAKWKPSWAN